MDTFLEFILFYEVTAPFLGMVLAYVILYCSHMVKEIKNYNTGKYR